MHAAHDKAFDVEEVTKEFFREYRPTLLPREELDERAAEDLWRNHAGQVLVEFPSPKTDGAWRLTAQGWVGYIPLSPELGIALRPKVGLSNLFRMLEYAYRLESFRFLDDTYDSSSLTEFYERLARVLARRVLDRVRKGLYRTYVGREERLPHLRGRLDARRLAQSPWRTDLPCAYQDRTADVEDNRILAWTLFVVARSGFLTEPAAGLVRKAYHALQGTVTSLPVSGETCSRRAYNRLNDDYRPLHALCRFFLDHAGPAHESGDRKMLPFLVDTARLYERFVAEWLRAHLPVGLSMVAQEPVIVDAALRFNLDVVLYDSATGSALCVLDTKYKAASAPSAEDVEQVVAYAEAKGCREAVLVYPSALTKLLDARVGRIRVRTLTFSPSGELDHAGKAFVSTLLSSIAVPAADRLEVVAQAPSLRVPP